MGGTCTRAAAAPVACRGGGWGESASVGVAVEHILAANRAAADKQASGSLAVRSLAVRSLLVRSITSEHRWCVSWPHGRLAQPCVVYSSMQQISESQNIRVVGVRRQRCVLTKDHADTTLPVMGGLVLIDRPCSCSVDQAGTALCMSCTRQRNKLLDFAKMERRMRLPGTNVCAREVNCPWEFTTCSHGSTGDTH